MLQQPVNLLLIANDPVVNSAALGIADDNRLKVSFRLLSATSFAQAIELCHSNRVDIIALDTELLQRDDSYRWQELEDRFPAAPLLSLGARESDANRYIARGRCNDFILKDQVTPYWFAKTVTQLLERQQVETKRHLHEKSHRPDNQDAMEFILRMSEETLFEQRERAQVILNSIADGVLTLNLAGKVSYLNPAAERMTGWAMDDALGLLITDVLTVIDSKTRLSVLSPVRHLLNECAWAPSKPIKFPVNSTLIHREGTELAVESSIAPIHNSHNDVTGFVIVLHDVTETRAITQKIMHMAQHDFLTGLPNRALLTERLTCAIGLAKRKGKQVGLLFVDLDNFKHINDSLGHYIGDQLLQSVAKRMKKFVRSTDTVCRQGGDEFVILLTEIEHRDDAAHVAEKLIAAFADPHIIDGKKINITLSIGVSIYPDDGNDIESAFHHADTAMYHAKRNGRNNYQFFHVAMKTRKVVDLKACYQ